MKTVTFFAFLLFAPVAVSGDFFVFDYFLGESDVRGVKLSLRHETNILNEYYENVTLNFEGGVNFWEKRSDFLGGSNFVLSVSPVFNCKLGSFGQSDVYFEVGVGFSFIDKTRFAGKDISTHFQFEDRIGLNMKFGKEKDQQVSLKYFHYSNAGIKSPNPGFDFISLSYMKRL